MIKEFEGSRPLIQFQYLLQLAGYLFVNIVPAKEKLQYMVVDKAGQWEPKKGKSQGAADDHKHVLGAHGIVLKKKVLGVHAKKTHDQIQR